MDRNNFDRHTIWKNTIVFMLVGIIVFTGFILWQGHNNRLLSVQTNSMAPTLIRGDAIVIKPVAANSLRVGDVISYQATSRPGLIITHRIIYINHSRQVVITKGDDVTISDGSIAYNQIIGRVVYTADRLGYILNFLRSRPGLIVANYIPAFGILLLEFRQLSKSYLRPTYCLPGRQPKALVLR